MANEFWYTIECLDLNAAINAAFQRWEDNNEERKRIREEAQAAEKPYKKKEDDAWQEYLNLVAARNARREEYEKPNTDTDGDAPGGEDS